MPDTRGPALVVDPSSVRVEAAHPRTLRPAEPASHFSCAQGLARQCPSRKCCRNRNQIAPPTSFA
jgi:hypothetical protein